MQKIKKTLRRIIPQWALSLYHYGMARIAEVRYGFPSRKIVVIGVTGTKGKTTASNFIWAVLTAGGKKTGLLSTAVIRIGDRQMINAYHMTMPGPFTLQRFLKDMVDDGCTHCVIETTSQGLAQWRHVGIWYDVAVFTNLAPRGTTEHVEAHGSLEAYRAAKGRLFSALMHHPQKTIEGELVPRIALVNNDSDHKDFFARFPVEHVATFGTEPGADYIAENITTDTQGVFFHVHNKQYVLAMLGEFNVMNALPAVALGDILGISSDRIAQGLVSFSFIPGRMEIINEGQEFGVIVDYAHEKVSMETLLVAARGFVRKEKKLIVVLGAEGGGRDKAKRPAMGELAGKLADYVVVSNVDPYDDDPKEIAEDIACAVENAGKIRETTLFVIEDRREGIRKALEIANRGDLVLVTGKGAEQSMIFKEKTMLWDDRMVVREELHDMENNKKM
ncbi:MAG: UDP-N-acetylmuramoyl-L-alanyl-D-glutamate--2,6-diaminopimelate ligase [Patescibacteria group bacterium]|nr:UDP-N-acetylmuramoyl-L-alanyl-D-glutamate--2,6-diaminopimelate ligase [Patescibacteria group bacterium]